MHVLEEQDGTKPFLAPQATLAYSRWMTLKPPVLGVQGQKQYSYLKFHM